jgi:hypothetical protein
MREDILEDPPLNRKQAESVAKLTDADIEIIDDAIVSNITGQWRKVARVVMATMFDLDDKNYGVPDLFYGQRVRALREKELSSLKVI